MFVRIYIELRTLLRKARPHATESSLDSFAILLLTVLQTFLPLIASLLILSRNDGGETVLKAAVILIVLPIGLYNSKRYSNTTAMLRAAASSKAHEERQWGLSALIFINALSILTILALLFYPPPS